MDGSRTENLNINETLKELQQFVNETEARHNQESQDQQRKSITYDAPTTEIKGSGDNEISNKRNTSLSDDGIDSLMRKLDSLESAQNILEQVFNTGDTNDIDIDALIAQLPLADPTLELNVENGEDVSQRSFNSEIASIQKIIDGGDSSCSIKSEVAGGNNLLSTSQLTDVSTSSKKERAVDDVLREYEEFERSLSRASAIDESFRSDVSSLPPLSAYSSKPEDAINSVPVIKPPVLKSTVSPSIVATTSASFTIPTTTSNNNSQTRMAPIPTRDIYCPPGSAPQNKNVSTKTAKKITEPKPTTVPKSSTRVEVSHSTPGVKLPASSSARSTTSAITTTRTSRELNQEAFKPRNRKSMRSPRTMISPRQTPAENFMDLPTNSSRIGAGGDGYQAIRTGMSNFQDKSEYAVAEAMKTIEKLNAMVARQETLLEAYSNDNQKLWTQLKDSKTESQEKETKFQDVINSLQTEVATMKLNHLVSSSSTANSPRQAAVNKAELQRLREDAELKSQQLMELRKEVLLLHSKLTEARSPVKPKQSVVAVTFSQEKEREYQKNINVLNKQVRTLQNILYSKDQTAPPPAQQQNNTSQTILNKSRPLQRTKSDVTKQNASMHQQAMIKCVRNTGVDAKGLFGRRPGSPGGGININTSGVLQASLSCLEQEREEFENIIAEKNKLIFEKERMILQLKDNVETLKSQLPEDEVVDHGFLDELRSRVITQNKVIQTLKEHLSSYKKMETENILLREEKSILEQQILDLKRKLEMTQNLGKPENEVLSILSEKVDELNSRYYHREKQLDTLLNRLTLKTTTGGNNNSSNLSPLRLSLGQFSNNNCSLGGALSRGRTSGMYSADVLNMADFSPTTSFQLFNAVSDLPEM
ncbi:hypothetical protein Ocin01_02179 [Orchesella cincta]|uniref:Uncharacterized protein n=1 Tax=Orchesella cincta TaxID=48709 RepID=A0A1D2NGY2_ORCCI|nr:hypothetical protein Ocin01_02179 [Orchesella cincta]